MRYIEKGSAAYMDLKWFERSGVLQFLHVTEIHAA